MDVKNFFRLALSVLVFTTLLTFNNCSDDEKEPVVTAAEGLYINEVSASGDDWVELYNSTNSAKNIGGYKISDDGASYELPGNTTVPANGYLVIFCDDGNNGLHTNFKLSSDGETVTLKNTANDIVDIFTYPKLDNGQSFGRYPDGTEDPQGFAISGLTSQGSSNNESSAPAITSVVRTPIVPALNTAVTIQATLTNIAELNTVKLFYRFIAEGNTPGAYANVNMSLTGVYYTATIPAQGAGATGEVDYYVEAKSTTGATSYKPFDAPVDAYDYILNDDNLPVLYINEIMASSTTCCPDNDGDTDEFDDWFEIYNPGASAVLLSGMYVSDNPADPFKSKIPNGISIPAGGYLLFWADEQGDQGPLHVNFKLSKGGESVGLYYIDGRKIDDKAFGGQDDNKSFGRNGNGAATWIQFNSPTPGAANPNP